MRRPGKADQELAAEMARRIGWEVDEGKKRLLTTMIYEVRTEALNDAALACEHYADHTTFLRKAAAARECADRIRTLAEEG